MLLSRDARLVSAVTLLLVPTIMYGGWTLLGILTRGTVSPSPNIDLDETQWALWRAGHAHVVGFRKVACQDLRSTLGGAPFGGVLRCVGLGRPAMAHLSRSYQHPDRAAAD